MSGSLLLTDLIHTWHQIGVFNYKNLSELVLVLILLVLLLLLLCADVFIYTDYQGFLCLLMSVCLGFLFFSSSTHTSDEKSHTLSSG